MKYKLILSLLCIFNMAFGQYIPAKHAEMSTGIYEKYKLLLDSAYLRKDHFGIGWQLSNLKAPTDSIFKYINLGIKNDVATCDQIFVWFRLFKNDRFLVNLVKSDTVQFVKSFDLCQNLLGDDAYHAFTEKETRDYKERIQQRPKLDSTNFDHALIAKLKVILDDDQKIRGETKNKDESSAAYKSQWKIQKQLDSVNLIKIDAIIKENGYPRKEQVGYDEITVWLVLQHQSDLKTRLQYEPFLQQAHKDGGLSQGLLETYEYRNNYIKLSEQK